MAYSNPSLVFIHGFRGAPMGFDAVVKHLEKDFDIHIPAIPPFAGATPLINYTPETYADFLASYLNTNHITKPVLIGHSMGSIIAAATAEKFPDLLGDKLIFISPISTKTPNYVRRAQPLVNIFPNRILSRITTNFLFIPQHSRKTYREALEKTIICGEQYTSKEDVLAAANFSTSYSISDFSFNKNTLMIVGDKDRVVSKRKTANFAHLRNFQLQIIKKSGHIVNYEQPEQLAKIIREFLDQ